ncbi:hypothetical protein PFISCL1PPCAC_23925 [Pristionchus fissidentatus]|uniref:Uncharacterized protein n=1 Tax=Pristionchus fissidentatus TaxID=1538716 RepID=A0AAV5WMM7_9BILA|nr:hypothetical protein PFISCL1PPCAC_23925 [Pristionchus fissidentatus]
MEYPEARSDYSPSTSQRREENGGFGMQSGWGERERVPSEPRSAFAVGRVTKEEEARLFGRGNGNEGGVRFQQEERRQRRGEEERGRGGNGGHNNNNSGTNGNSFAVKMQLDTPHKRVKFQIVELLKWRRDLNLSRPQNEYQLLEAEKLFSLLQIATGEEMDIYWVTEKMEKDLYWFIEQMEVRENLLVRYSGQAWNAAANKFIEVMYVTDPDYVPPPHLRLRRVRNVDG